MTNESDSFVREVDESLRQDRMLAIAKRYGPWIIGLFAVFIISLGGWQVWSGYQTRVSREHAAEFAAAQETARQAIAQQGDLDPAKAEFERLAGEGPRVYRAMARMERAALLSLEGDLEAALAEFDAAAEISPDPTMRESAQIRAAYIAAETQDFAALRTRLEPLIESDTRVSYLARELLAIEAWEAGDLDLARNTLQELTLAFEAPDTVRQRAQVALGVIGPGEETPADGAATAPAPSEGESK
ncbi:MAG: tetratricopeptide repeat protein [Caulobacteraceae bacterium]